MSLELANPVPSARAAYPINRIRADFPALQSGWAYFDGPGGTQTPRVVGEAVAAVLTGPLSNRGSGAPSQRNADEAVAAFRLAMADLLDAEPSGIVFGRSATQLTYDFARALAKTWGPGDEIVVSRLDHDANIRPWIQSAAASGATVRWAEFDPETTELTVEHVAAVLSERTRLVALTGASNLVGTKPPIGAVARLAHSVGAFVYVDAVHAAAHAALSLRDSQVDFLVCSPYKFLGPHCGVLAASPELLETVRPDKLLPATEVVPERFEFGTLPYEVMAGVTAAVDYLASLGASQAADRRARLVASFHAIEEHEDRLRLHLEAVLAALDGIRVWSRAASRTPTLLLTFASKTAAAAFHHLLEFDILAPAGSFYALEPSRHLGLGGAGGLRVGLAPYTDDNDVERLIEALASFIGGRAG